MVENSKSLSTFSFKLILLLVFTFLLIRYVIIPYAPYLGHDRKYRYEISTLNNIPSDNADIAFFSNSYVYTAYDPTLIKSELNLDAYHFNSSSQILESSLLVAKHVLEEKSFKYVVFDVSKSSLVRPKNETEKSWYFQSIALQEIPFSLDKYQKINSFFPKDEYFEYYINALSSSFGKFFQLNKREKFSASNTPPFAYYHFNGALFSERGYFAYDFNKKSIPKDAFNTTFSKAASSKVPTDQLWNSNRKKELINFIEFSKSKGTNVILVNSLKLRDEHYNSAFIDSLTAQFSHLKFLNLNSSRKDYNLSNMSFFDTSHVTYLGSYEVTHRLIDSLLRWDKNLQPKTISHNFKVCNLKKGYFNFKKNRDSYIKLEFDSIPTLLKNHTLVLSVYPKDLSLLSHESKEKGLEYDKFHFTNVKDATIKTDDSEVFIKRLNTTVVNDAPKKIKLFFYKENDTLDIPSFQYVFE